MKKFTFLILSVCTAFIAHAQQYSLWQFAQNPPPGKPILQPYKYMDIIAGEDALKAFLSGVGTDPGAAQLISLPQPDGTLRAFHIWQSLIMAQPLANKYPDILTYTATAADNHLVTAKIDYTPFGFHAVVADGAKSFYIDPYSKMADGRYITYYRSDYRGAAGSNICGVKDKDVPSLTDFPAALGTGLPPILFRMNGSVRRTYRLALACTGEYAVAVAGPTPTKGAVLAKMVTTINRVNSVYERDLAITMQLVANDDTLIFLDGNTDPYSNTNAFAMLTQNQATADARIKKVNYDIGHVFGTGGGGGGGTGLGVAYHGTCNDTFKAQGVTGTPNPTGDPFDIDYVAHEMGHQYGADHTFNNNSSGACNGGAKILTAYEPGSGSTIMGYAGICDNDNLQMNSDAYFHSSSLEQITIYVTDNTCASLSPSGNNNATLPAFTASYSIPYLTAFELTAPQATDGTADTVNYCWEQRDLGDFGRTIALTRRRGPLFRSFMPSASRTRIFPTIDSLLKSVFISRHEKVPDTARTLCFRLTERDIYQGFGTFNFPDDSIHLDVIYTGSPFRVTSPNASVTWAGGTAQTVTWNVGSTNLPPINCSNVDIFLSTDGGYTFPTTLVSNTPNDGSEGITLPSGSMSNMRVKVKATGNVFFAISHTAPPTTIDSHLINNGGVLISPVPANTQVEVRFVKAGESAEAKIINAVGQIIWAGTVKSQQVINVASWAKGMYYARLTNGSTINTVIPFLVN